MQRQQKGEGSVFQRKSDGRWIYRLRRNGKDIVVYLDATTEREARREAVKAKQRIFGEVARGEHDAPTAETITVGGLIDDYLRHIKLKKRASAYEIECVLNAHVRPRFGDRSAASITSRELSAYRDWRRTQRTNRDTPPTHNTIDHELAYLRSAFILGSKQTPPLVDRLPYFEMSGEDQIRTGFIERDGYVKIFDALPASLKPVFCVAYHVGDRKGELLRIHPDQCDLASGYIVLRTGETKNREGRHLPIYGDMRTVLACHKARVLTEWPKARHLFVWLPEDRQRSVKPGTAIKDFRATWATAVKAAGYPDLLFHDLRRSAVRNMLQDAGLDEHTVLGIIGHKTASMLRRYNITSRSTIDKAKEKLEQWSRNERMIEV